MLDILECITKATEAGKIRFESSGIRPGESVGFKVEEPSLVMASVVEVEGVDVIVFTLPFIDKTIYATNSLVDFKKTLLEKAAIVVLGSNRTGHRNKLSFEAIRKLQNKSSVSSSDYGFVDYSERDKLLEELRSL